jgi:hypothetical protein
MNQFLSGMRAAMAAIAAFPLFYVPGFLACMLQQ